MLPSVLVTGAAEYLGSRIAEALRAARYDVVAFDGEVRDRAAVMAAAEGVGHIIHLAGHDAPQNAGLEVLSLNVEGAENVLEVARLCGAGVVYGSTDEVYGKTTSDLRGADSDLIVGGGDKIEWCQAVSRLVAEHYCFAYREKYALPVRIIRYPSRQTAAESGDDRPAVERLAAATIQVLEDPSADGRVTDLGFIDRAQTIRVT